jgi:hypothetical protein
MGNIYENIDIVHTLMKHHQLKYETNKNNLKYEKYIKRKFEYNKITKNRVVYNSNCSNVNNVVIMIKNINK